MKDRPIIARRQAEIERSQSRGIYPLPSKAWFTRDPKPEKPLDVETFPNLPADA
jgi:hypothetical protein